MTFLREIGSLMLKIDYVTADFKQSIGFKRLSRQVCNKYNMYIFLSILVAKTMLLEELVIVVKLDSINILNVCSVLVTFGVPLKTFVIK